jgi:CRP-like cAMP-binding protein
MRTMRAWPDEWTPGSFLDRLPAPTREALLAIGTRRQFESGHRIIREGERSSHVELLIRGFVKVTTVVDGNEALMAIRVPGDILGETASLTGRARTATVTACGRVTSSVIKRAAFHSFLVRHPEAAVQMAATVTERLRWANLRRAEFTAYPAEVRLARLLVDLAETCGRPTDDGVTIAARLSQPELASMVGIADATAQKAIRDMRTHGLIRTGYRRITIIDLAALRAVSEGGAG